MARAEEYVDFALDDIHWESGQALGFPIRFDLVLKHLRQDMRDDWYYDCLQFDDLFKNKRSTQNIILSILNEWNGAYSGNKSVVRNIPKKGYGERYGLETDFFDRFMYQAICSFLIPYYDKLLSHRVLSYRYQPNTKNDKYLFKNKIGRWLTFEGVTLTFARSSKFLLVTDLSNFFESVSRKQLVQVLNQAIPDIDATGPEKLQIRNAVNTLDSLLTQWTFSGDHGLPQNRDASSFLSNMLLLSVDKKMVEKGYDYFRYVDDIRIIADSEPHARRALQDLIRQLRTVGMNINTGKTEILAPDASPDKIAEYFPSQDSRTTAINNMWNSRSRRLVAKSVTYIFDMLKSCISNGETQSRQFRFAVNRVSLIVDSGLFSIADELANEMLAILSASLRDNAASTDQYCRLISILDVDGRCLPQLEAFLLDERGSIHDWQNYNIWLLLASRQYKTDALVALADRKLLEELGSGESASILIWLRCVSEAALIERCVGAYSEALPHQNSRYLLMAASILPEESLKPLHGQVVTKLKGTAARTAGHHNEMGLPFSVRDKPNLVNFVDEVSGYD